jgi:glutamate-5-semialdehyde dehydrogenase
LPELAALFAKHGVALRACPQSLALLPGAELASEQDWGEEYLAPVLSVRLVPDLDAAIAHINQYSSGHTEAIMTEDFHRAQRFLREVDSSSVMVNA